MEEKITAPETEQNLPQEVEVVDIQFRTGQKVYFFDPDGAVFQNGDHVIIDTSRGPEFGICVGGNHTIAARDVVAPLRKVLRLATAQDERTVSENRAKEKRAYDICMRKIGEHGLDMQLVSAEYAFDGSKILFFFTADERVDFRDLVKDLAGVFHTRIELRQIGVRDKAKMVGGLGICGRPFCCAQFLDDFQPVSIKMAKTQNLSLNPTKISGTCGRLMCCLKYEQDAYEDLIRNSPKAESFVDTPEGRGTVVDVNLLRQSVKVRMEDQPEKCCTFGNCEICVLRNGKAKKNDPPIPDDLAPISGGGKRVKEREKEDAPLLEPIRFRYRDEDVVEEAPREPVPTEPAQEPARSSRSRRRRKNAVKTLQEDVALSAQETPRQQPKKQKPAQPQKPEAEPAAGESAPKEGRGNHRRRRPNYRRGHKPRQNGSAE